MKITIPRIIGTIFLSVAVLYGVILLYCSPDGDLYPVSSPLAKAVVEHIEKHGVPESLENVENLPYKLIPCEEKSKETQCQGYFFKKGRSYYSVNLEKLPRSDGKNWINLSVEHHKTVNYYSISVDANISNNAFEPLVYRRLVGICSPWTM